MGCIPVLDGQGVWVENGHVEGSPPQRQQYENALFLQIYWSGWKQISESRWSLWYEIAFSKLNTKHNWTKTLDWNG